MNLPHISEFRTFKDGNQFTWNHLKELLIPLSHDLHVSRHRADTIINRVRLISAGFALINFIWIFIDYAVFTYDVWNSLILLRIGVISIFVLLSITWRVPHKLPVAFLFLFCMLLNPLGFYLFSQSMFNTQEFTGWAGISLQIYSSLPLIVMAGLSVFPLALIESLLLLCPIGLSLAFGLHLSDTFSWDHFLASLWVMVLIAGVYIISGMIQIHYMIMIVNKVSLDTLTGAFTRRSGEEILDLYFHISARHETPFAIAFADLDRFKAINDDYGHDAGDAALRQAAHHLSKSLRRGDVVIRWGGEEFLLILNGADVAGTQHVIDRITHNWLGERPDGEPLTASIGLAERIVDQTPDWPELIELADKRMYEAKNSGRARCVMPDM